MPIQRELRQARWQVHLSLHQPEALEGNVGLECNVTVTLVRGRRCMQYCAGPHVTVVVGLYPNAT